MTEQEKKEAKAKAKAKAKAEAKAEIKAKAEQQSSNNAKANTEGEKMSNGNEKTNNNADEKLNDSWSSKALNAAASQGNNFLDGIFYGAGGFLGAGAVAALTDKVFGTSIILKSKKNIK